MAGRAADRLPRGVRPAAAAAVLAFACAFAAGATGATGRAAPAQSCSSYGERWLASYNRQAAKQGNPVRILTACCQPTRTAGINHCFVMVTLAGTTDRGCESVDIGRDGLPAGPGKHESCLVHDLRQLVA